MPTLQTAGHTIGSVRPMGKHAFVCTAVDGHAAIRMLNTVGYVEDVTRVDITPHNVV